jgi:predicted signal transduction protein with EAL and GGDEF domain
VTVGELYGHPFTSRGSFVIDVAGRFVVYIIVLLVAGAARAAHAREQALARSDSLTGLVNRAALSERIGIEIERQKRSGRPMTLAYIDCDDFKRVNDRLQRWRGGGACRAPISGLAHRSGRQGHVRCQARRQERG